MGRHRSDPRGLARILIAAIAVVLALALLVVGAMAVIGALTSDSEQPGPAGTTTESTAGSPSGAASKPKTTASASAATPLVIRVTGAPTTVTVTVAGTGEVLQNGVLTTNEARQYDQAPLNVVAADAGSVEVTIYGRLQPRGQDGQRGVWTVPKR